jgi:hypothetical protein
MLVPAVEAQPEDGDHHDARAGAEVASVDARQQREEGRHRPHPRARADVLTAA